MNGTTALCLQCGQHASAHRGGAQDHAFVSGTCATCGEPSGRLTQGECGRCYTYRWHRGQPRPASVDQRGTARPCRYPGCSRRDRQRTRGYCRAHYQAWWRRRRGLVSRPYHPHRQNRPVRRWVVRGAAEASA